ncbi:hypothetical protein BC6307_09820 [Sutcliffiella cohnii]|uniref:YncE family protein n=1 Tax=Sutcliffiella cohnii TaxID=33932 RepID=A0A223KQ25_9BACI|nr:hypothetical protein [Sutcliffiella cohnii]AST91559.1 hypothetical protein BC6307_09820 [Sutcliffiella cohnii]
MIRTIFFLLCFLTLIGCSNQQISIPEFEEKPIIVSHLKSSDISFISNGKISTIPLSFTITDIVETTNFVVIGSKNDGVLYKLDFEENKIDSLTSKSEGISKLYYEESTGVLFIVNALENSVELVDVENGQTLTKIEVGQYPIDMIVSGEMGYVLNSESHSVSVIDLKKEEVLFNFPVLERPSGMLLVNDVLYIGGHGKSGVLNNQIYIYSATTGEMMGSKEVGLMPIDFSFDNNTEYIYVVCHGSNEVIKIDSQDLIVKDKLTVASNPNFINSDENYLYVTSLDGNELTIINLSTFRVIDTFTIDNGPFVVIPGGEL